MKNFDEWLKGKAGIGWYTGAEEGWKAALEWVLGRGGPLSEGVNNSDYAKLRIKKELEEIEK